LRVEVENGIIVCGTDSDWKNLPENEHEFLYKCYGFWVGFTKNGKLLHSSTTKSADLQELFMRRMINAAETCGVEVTEEVREIYKDWKARAEEDRIIQEWLAFMESKRKTWEYRERTGCDGCRECERIGEGWFRCKRSGDDLEARFSEVWDPVTQCMVIFHEVGVPNAHCKDYYQERKLWR
jgi:hypothetical protein